MNMMPEVVELTMTCSACPAQWNGKTKCGQEVYIRFRWGFLSASLDGVSIYGESLGDTLDGYMDEPEMKKALVNVLFFNEELI